MSSAPPPRPPRAHRPARAARDQHESAFAAILAELIVRVPGARAAALVDRDGETVDYSGHRDAYDMKVAAAHLRIVLDVALQQPALTRTRSLVIRASRSSFVIHTLPEGYALVLWLARGAGFRGLARAIPACIRRLANEAGWKGVPSPWHLVDVDVDPRGLPSAVRFAHRESPLEVLGRFRTALPEHEKAWRVRVPTGKVTIECTLVRESTGFWYMDDLLTA